jgi:hypothetical protein
MTSRNGVWQAEMVADFRSINISLRDECCLSMFVVVHATIFAVKGLHWNERTGHRRFKGTPGDFHHSHEYTSVQDESHKRSSGGRFLFLRRYTVGIRFNDKNKKIMYPFFQAHFTNEPDR